MSFRRFALALAVGFATACAVRNSAAPPPPPVRVSTPPASDEARAEPSPPEPGAHPSTHLEIVLDMSGSMFMLAEQELAPTGASTPSRRFDLAKEAAIELISHAQADSFGVVVFAKSAERLEAESKGALLEAVQQLKVGAIDGTGSDLTAGIVTALSEIRHGHDRIKRVVVLTDGNVDHGSLDPRNTAELAKSLDAPIYVLQIGNLENTTVQSGVDLFGTPVFVKAPSPIDHELLSQLARDSRGEVIVVTERAAFERALGRIGK